MHGCTHVDGNSTSSSPGLSFAAECAAASANQGQGKQATHFLLISHIAVALPSSLYPLPTPHTPQPLRAAAWPPCDAAYAAAAAVPLCSWLYGKGTFKIFVLAKHTRALNGNKTHIRFEKHVQILALATRGCAHLPDESPSTYVTEGQLEATLATIRAMACARGTSVRFESRRRTVHATHAADAASASSGTMWHIVWQRPSDSRMKAEHQFREILSFVAGLGQE